MSVPAFSKSQVEPRTKSASLPEPWLQDWPADGLEVLNRCPLCRSSRRTICHDSLVDSCFRVSPGRWKLWRCTSCYAAYLDPRPTAATIHMAYSSYYTHTATYAPAPGTVQRIRRRLSDGYANRRYGCMRSSGSRWGPVAAQIVPLIAWIADREFRHLPAPTGSTRRLLDVGCGNGEFLSNAMTCGWQVLGLEPDPKAAEAAQKRGVPVHIGGLDSLDGEAELFDVISMSHVVEHLHDPIQALHDCRRLLRPGGSLWLETPNIDSLGHTVFGRSWRGVEAPRHLVLFSPPALQSALDAAGFVALKNMRSPSPRRWVFERSLAIAEARLPDDVEPLPWALQRQATWADWGESVDSTCREFLTVVASRG